MFWLWADNGGGMSAGGGGPVLYLLLYLVLYLFVYLKQQKRVIDSKNGSNYLLLYLLNKRKHI